jgi:hypothetical protein
VERTLIHRIACVFAPDRPIGWLARSAGVAHSTAKTWAYGHKSWAYGNRRPPIYLLKGLQIALEETLPTHKNQVEVLELSQLLRGYLWEREQEPMKPRAGFNVIRERDGPGSIPRDGRNRRGRPRRLLAAAE